eukprot:6187801-Pleurochrysis_carterae.AAC.2
MCRLPAGGRQPQRKLFDVKAVHAWTAYYLCPTRAALEAHPRGCAVASRAAGVPVDYEAVAREADTRHHGLPGPPRAQAASGLPDGPDAAGTTGFPAGRGLVFGSFEEASAKVHDLCQAVSREMVERHWRAAGFAREVEGRRPEGSSRSGLLHRRCGTVITWERARPRVQRLSCVASSVSRGHCIQAKTELPGYWAWHEGCVALFCV